METMVNRRLFVTGAATVVGALGLWPAVACIRWDGHPVRRWAAQLSGVLRHQAAAGQIGRAYLRAHPSEADPERLIAGITGGWEQGPAELDRLGRDALRLRLREQIRADFAQGRTVLVEGWVLATSEARLFGLSALIQA
jgi:hypothetical protein